MDTVVILSCFNFSENPARVQALHQTLISLQKVVDVILVCHRIAVEDLPNREDINVIDVPRAAIVWQKERFFNLALQYVKPYHRYVCWSDSDLVYNTSENWVDKLKEKLEVHCLIQLFDQVWDVSLQIDGLYRVTGEVRKSAVKLLMGGQITSEQFFTQSGISMKIGCNPGMAWGTHADLIKSIGFPDFMLLGSGDKTMLAAAMNRSSDYYEVLGLNCGLHDHYHEWSKKASGQIQNSVGYIDNSIYHIAQGNYQTRYYGNRYTLIQNGKFELDRYLYINPHGAWQWYDENNQYSYDIQHYFHGRGD